MGPRSYTRWRERRDEYLEKVLEKEDQKRKGRKNDSIIFIDVDCFRAVAAVSSSNDEAVPMEVDQVMRERGAD